MTSMTIWAFPSFCLIPILILVCILGEMVSLLANVSHWVDNVTHLCYREEFNLTHESHWCGPKDECSQKGMILPIFNEVTWPIWLRIVLYFGGLLYSFVAVFIVADIFMCSIDAITSTTKKITVSGPDGQQEVMEVPVWNGTIANIVLMSLGPR